MFMSRPCLTSWSADFRRHPSDLRLREPCPQASRCLLSSGRAARTPLRREPSTQDRDVVTVLPAWLC